MGEYRARGVPLPEPTSQLPLPGGSARVREAVRIAPAARADVPPVPVDAAPRDLVEVELENGIVFWTSVEQLQEDVGAAKLRARDAGPGELPTRYPQPRPAERGVVGVAIKSLKILDVDLPRNAAQAAAERIESRLEGGAPGLYRIDERGELHADAIPAGSERVLVFIHGTASSTRGAFSGLTRLEEQAVAWKELHRHYGGRVFGFEHKTLTESPLDNALQLVEALPAGRVPPLHLVSHSRGGLVGDLVCFGGRSPAFPSDLLDAALRRRRGNREEGEARRRELAKFERLNGLLERVPPVQRFVRVACPAGGTTLASGRLDIYLSVLVRLLGGIPLAGPFLEGLGELVAAVAKERTKPDVLPGLAAQMPESALVRVLHGIDPPLESDLTVISGDSDGLLKNLANLFYWRANDLVVDTRSMYRGAPRRTRRWYRAEGREVHHTNYFARTETVKKLVDGLTRSEAEDGGFATTRPRAVVRGHVPAGRPEERPGQPAVILIPGIMGSHLSVTREGSRNRVWLDLSDLMKGRIGQLAIDGDGSPTVSPDGVVERGYADFAAFLRERGHHVIPHDYDWRLSLAGAAERLAELLAKRLEASREPVRLVAHSMGGLVARLLIGRHSEVWERAVLGGGRLVQLGTPNGGSHVIPAIFRGEEGLVRKLARVDLERGPEGWVELLARFPGLLEMAPQSAEPDFSKVGTWEDLGVLTAPSSADLEAAKKTVNAIRSVDLAEHPAVYVAGRADDTPTMLPGGTVLATTSRGDGRVTWESGIPPGVPHWFVDVRHGSLADSEPAFEGLLDLVVRGRTDRLSTAEPSPRRAVRARAQPSAGAVIGFTPAEDVETAVFPSDEALEAAVFPTQEALEAAALGMEEDEPWDAPAPPAAACAVQVVHGDLSYARHPVLVGHYAGDPLLSAEAVLDRRLGGVLSARHLLDLYPRDVGTHELVLRPGSARPGGALVVGLGNVGTLTPGGLTRTVEEAVVRYVRTSHESAADPGAAREGLGLASLLVGSGEAGLSLEQVIRSILLGVRLANQRVRQAGGEAGAFPGVDRLELLELYEDRALQALHVLRSLARLGFEDFAVATELEHAPGRRRRASFREPGGWWLPLTVCEAEGKRNVLELVASGQRARVVPEEVPIQPELIDRLLERPLASVSPAHRRLAETLFELLLPHRLKKGAAERQNVLLIVDETTARYPWEMLADRLARTRRPVGVDAGLVRQLRLRKTRTDVSHPESRLALVVGDPPSSLPALPGAREEAARVAELLARRSWAAVRQIRGDAGSEKSPGESEIDPESVLTTAMTCDPRILHLAGHGVYDPAAPARTGMVIGGDHGAGSQLTLLSPAEIAQMRLVPELVFVNCCHLGRIEETPPHLLAANLATQFIASGVRAVVAAGWAVDDAAALAFADAFYEQMFGGRTFGEAVLAARQRTFDDFPDTNTWAAYQCYGDPGFRLMMDVEVREAVVQGKADEYVDPVEVAADLYNLLGRAKCERSGDDRKRLRDELDRIADVAVARGWDDDGEIHARLARAYAEIGEFEAATRHYETARSTPDGTITIGDLEQLANVRARWAADRAVRTLEADERAGEAGAAGTGRREAFGSEQAKVEIDRSIAELEAMETLAITKERSALLGSAYKRLVQVWTVAASKDKAGGVDAGSLNRALARMAASYGRAAAADPSDLYPAINALSAVLVLGGPWMPDRLPDDQRDNPLAPAAAFDAALEVVLERAAEQRERTFWAQTYAPDAAVVACLRRDELGKRGAELAETYKALFRDYGSPREHASVLDQIDLLARQLRRIGSSKAGTVSETRRKRMRAQSGQLETLLAELGRKKP